MTPMEKKIPDRNLDTSCPAGIPCKKPSFLVKGLNFSCLLDTSSSDVSSHQQSPFKRQRAWSPWVGLSVSLRSGPGHYNHDQCRLFSEEGLYGLNSTIVNTWKVLSANDHCHVIDQFKPIRPGENLLLNHMKY